jgi:hypothetical protein
MIRHGHTSLRRLRLGLLSGDAETRATLVRALDDVLSGLEPDLDTALGLSAARSEDAPRDRTAGLLARRDEEIRRIAGLVDGGTWTKARVVAEWLRGFAPIFARDDWAAWDEFFRDKPSYAGSLVPPLFWLGVEIPLSVGHLARIIGGPTKRLEC